MNLEKFKELKFTKWCIENSTSVYIFTILICLAGWIAYQRIPKELFPDIVVPTISIATRYRELNIKAYREAIEIYQWY